MATSSPTQLRAASYCRTSGEGQRDNTSIPRQKEANEEFIKRNEWRFVSHYIDECKSGSKEEGRDAFQRMMRDAANGLFDIVVVFDIKRFSRDGSDIIRNADLLRSTFKVHVVDTKNQFDTRDRRNTLVNYVHAGISEQETIDIMERLFGGRIERAKDGLPWTTPPFGRRFVVTCKKPLQGYWEISEKGLAMRELLTRYADGESLLVLAKEYGFKTPTNVLANVRRSQLSGTYVAKFDAKKLDIHGLEIEVPSVPEVITPELEQRVRAKMANNRKWNKEHLNKYYLSGLICCAECGRTLVGAQRGNAPDGMRYYRHNSNRKFSCEIKSIPAEIIEPQALDHLYHFFIDQPAFEEALRAAMPSCDDRAALQNDLTQCEKSQRRVQREIQNLVNAIAGGADLGLLLDKQSELISQRDALATRFSEISATVATLPDFDQIKQHAAYMRIMLMEQCKGQDWRELPYEDVRRFLRHLFGENCRATGNGIFVSGQKDKLKVTFKGVLNFTYDLVDGKRRLRYLDQYADSLNAEIDAISRNTGRGDIATPGNSERSL